MRTILIALAALCTAALAGDALPDIEGEAVKGRCSHKPIAAADSNYTGELHWTEDGAVTGHERRLLFANARWKANAGEDGEYGRDCVIHWKVVGTRKPATGCAKCDFGVHFQADIDYDTSTCAMRMMLEGNHFRGAYDIDLHDDGTLDVYFSNSGKKLGRGYHRGTALNWISDHRCLWM